MLRARSRKAPKGPPPRRGARLLRTVVADLASRDQRRWYKSIVTGAADDGVRGGRRWRYIANVVVSDAALEAASDRWARPFGDAIHLALIQKYPTLRIVNSHPIRADHGNPTQRPPDPVEVYVDELTLTAEAS